LYHFKKDKLKELLGEKTVVWLSKELDYTPQMLYNIFNDNIGCRKIIAQAIVKTMSPSFTIKDFFDYIERK
jgi:hypothetical protein